MAVPTVHENVHERTSQQGEPNQKPQHVCAVLGEQQDTCDDQKSDQNQSGARF